MRHILFCFFSILLLGGSVRASPDSLTVRGPFRHGRLTIYLLETPSRTAHPYLTLDNALRSGRAVVHENNSQTLWIENRSDSDLFVQSGEIIKGGQQDRLIARDMIVAAHDTSRDLRVYCVERGRSTKRGSEPIETFSMSPELAPANHLRLVAQNELTGKLLSPHLGGLTAPDPEQARLFASLQTMQSGLNRMEDPAQEAVWNDVGIVQSGLTRALRDSVTHNTSPTSLELSLEHPSLASQRKSFEHDLASLANDNPNAVGVLCMIDDKIIGADSYASHDLFAALWPKLLRSVATESLVAPANQGNPGPHLTTDDFLDYMNESHHGPMAQDHVNDRTLTEVTKTDRGYRFITRDTKYADADLHTAIIAP